MAEPRITVNINADEVFRQLRGIQNTTYLALSRGLNDSAFELRKFWQADMQTFLDKPTFFTKKVFVNKAAPDPRKLLSTTFLPRIQSEYLERVMEGGVRKVGDYASLNNKLLLPVNATLNKFGNFPLGPKRWLGRLEGRIKNSFVGSPNGEGGGREAVYQRRANGRLKLLAIFKEVIPYEKRLPLEKTTETYAPQAEQNIQKNLDKLLRS